jgi:RNA polymerase sigma-B factor
MSTRPVAYPALDDRALMARHRAGDARARAQLVERYLPLARKLALRYRHSGEPVEDLFQVAAIGLLKAVDRWEPERGHAFSSFAVPTVLGELRRHFRDATWSVRPPRSIVDLALQVERAREKLGGEPTVAQLAAHVERSPEDVAAALVAGGARRPWSLDAPALVEGSEMTIADQLGGDDAGYAHVEARATVDRLLTLLDHRAREIIRLGHLEGVLQRQIAARFGLSQVHVSRIVCASLAKLELAA